MLCYELAHERGVSRVCASSERAAVDWARDNLRVGSVRVLNVTGTRVEPPKPVQATPLRVFGGARLPYKD